MAELQSQPDVVFEPVIHASAEIDRVRDTATEQQRISAGHERREFARLARVQEMVGDIGREDTKAGAQSVCKAKVADFTTHAESFVNQPFAAHAEMQGRVSFRSASRRDENVPLPAAL